MGRSSRSSFDIESRRLGGAPFPLAQDVAVYQPMLGHFSANSDLIVYVPRQAMTSGMHMTLVDRKGTTIRSIGEVAEYCCLRVSADGTRLAIAQRDPISGTRDIWVHDLNGKTPIRLTFDGHDDMAPAWSADGRTILFTSDRSGERDVYQKDADRVCGKRCWSFRRRTARASTHGPQTASSLFTIRAHVAQSIRKGESTRI